jgi:hypothetical protein
MGSLGVGDFAALAVSHLRNRYAKQCRFKLAAMIHEGEGIDAHAEIDRLLGSIAEPSSGLDRADRAAVIEDLTKLLDSFDEMHIGPRVRV